MSEKLRTREPLSCMQMKNHNYFLYIRVLFVEKNSIFSNNIKM